MILWTTCLWVLSTIVGVYSGCSHLYGHEPCKFVPAPPGKTPPCARPGQTYCEYPEHYPGQLIDYLIEKWRFDHSTIIKDETRQDFASYFYPPPKAEYGPPGYHNFGPNVINPPEPIYIPKPQYPLRFNEGNTYGPPNGSLLLPHPEGSPPVYQQQVRNGQFYTYKYPNNFPNVNRPEYSSYQNYLGGPQYDNRVWKRKAEVKYGRLKRSLRFKRSQQILDKNFENISSNKTLSLERKRRQATVSGEPICQSRSQFIMPRAALNNEGNWMYVVNMPELNNRYTQMVRSETCVSQTCSSICSLPVGYSSRCEQKYIQKRLVALEGGGNNLYTDLFWFPSCCVCTLSNS